MLQLLNAELATTRQVTDQGWLPHVRQVGLTGLGLRGHQYIVLTISGHIYHTCGMQAAGTVLAVNNNPDAGICDHTDIGLRADWADCVPYLIRGLEQVLG